MDHLFKEQYKSKSKIARINKTKNVVIQRDATVAHKDHVALEIQVAKNLKFKRRNLSNSTI